MPAAVRRCGRAIVSRAALRSGVDLPMYWWLARFFRFLVGRLYRLEILGRPVPAEGPVILVGNHPNGLMDPALMLRVSNRELRFLAKEPLFRMPVLGWIVKGMRALPVYRAQDGFQTDANQLTFSAVHAALARGDAVVVFPEGKSHNEASTQRLKTGAARMALGTDPCSDPSCTVDVRVVPIGFNYADKTRFRSSVALVIGEPIPVSDFRTAEGAEDRAAVTALTERISRDLARVTIQLENWEELPLLRLAERVWNPAPKRARGQRLAVLSHAATRLRTEDPERFRALRKRVQDLAETLDRVGLPSSRLGTEYTRWKVAAFVLRNTVLALLGLPLGALAIVTWSVPVGLCKLTIVLGKPTPDVVTTFQGLGALVFFPLWHLAVTLFAAAQLGWTWALAIAVLWPVLSWIGWLLWERHRSAYRDALVFLRLAFSARRRRYLQLRRDLIADEFADIADRWREEAARGAGGLAG